MIVKVQDIITISCKARLNISEIEATVSQSGNCAHVFVPKISLIRPLRSFAGISIIGNIAYPGKQLERLMVGPWEPSILLIILY